MATRCQNSSRGIGSIVTPRCFNGTVAYECTVNYDPHNIESDTLLLCAECTNALKRDVRKHKYKFSAKRVT